jgi:outer membrane protein OmpA-like peptidoglycan-associated protein
VFFTFLLAWGKLTLSEQTFDAPDDKTPVPITPKLPYMKHFAFLIGFFCWIISAFGQQTNLYQSWDSKRLFEQAFYTRSISQKVHILYILKNRNENTPYSAFSGAYLAEYEGLNMQAVKLYEKCIQDYPNFLPSIFQLSKLVPAARAIQLNTQVIAKDISFNEYSSVRYIFSIYIDSLGNSEAAFHLLDDLQHKYPKSGVFDYLRAAHYFDDNKDSAAYYIALSLSKEPGFAPARILQSKLSLIKEDAQPFIALYKEYRSHPISEELGGFIVTTLAGDFNDDLNETISRLRSLYEIGADSQSSPYLMQRIYDVAFEIAKDPSLEIFGILLKAKDRFPDDQDILNKIGSAYWTMFNDSDNAKIFLDAAILNSFTQRDRNANLIRYANMCWEDRGDFYAADSILARAQSDSSGLISYEKYMTSLLKKKVNLPVTLGYIDLFLANQNRNSAAFAQGLYNAKRRNLENLIESQRRSEELYGNNPGIEQWKDSFTNKLRISLLFDENSVAISSGYNRTLGAIKAFFRSVPANKSILLIEGNAAQGEDDPDGLGERRAKAVLRYLVDSVGIPQEYLKMASRGDKLPVATNAIKKERAKNMRVEISPYWSFSQPRILVTSTLDPNKTVALSSDGRTLALGTQPLQLWDAGLKIKLRDLGVGGQLAKFSPDGRYIATVANSYIEEEFLQSVLMIYDCKTGTLYDQIPWIYEIEAIAWNPYSSEIAFTTGDNFLVKYDLEQKQKKDVVKMRFDNVIPKGLVWTTDDKYLINGYAGENYLFVWSSKDLSLMRKLSDTYWPHALEQSKDGKLLFCASNGRFLTIYDLETWRSSSMPVPVLSGQIVVHPYKPIILMNDWGAGDKNELVEIDYQKKKVLSSITVNEEDVHCAFSPDGESIYVALDDTLKILGTSDLKEKSIFEGLSYTALGSQSDTANNLFLSYDRSGIYGWDISTGFKRFSWNVRVDNIQKLRGAASQFLIVTKEGDSSFVYRFNSKDFSHRLWGTIPKKIDFIRSTDSLIILACQEFVNPNKGNKFGDIDVYQNTGNCNKLRTITVPLLTGRLRHGQLNGSGFQDISISTDYQNVAVTSYWMDGFKLGATISKQVNVYTLANGTHVDSTYLTEQIYGLSYNKNRDLVLKTIQGTYNIDRTTQHLKFSSDLLPNEEELNLADGSAKIVWSREFLTVYKDSKPLKKMIFPGNLIGVEVFESKNLLLTLTTENEISFYDLKGFENRLTIVPKKDNEWIAYTPQGNFQSSLFGSEKAFWSYGDNYIEFSQLRNEFENTRLIAGQLDAIRQNTFHAVAGIDSNVKNSLSLGRAFQVISVKSVDTSSSKYVLEFMFDKGQIQGFQRQGWKVEVDFTNEFTRLDGEKEIIDMDSLDRGNGNICHFSKAYDLEAGYNSFFLTLLPPDNINNYAFRDLVKVFNRSGNSAPAGLPNLYFLGIAVDRYTDSTLSTIKYTTKDVSDVGSLLKKQEHVMYDKVDVEYILNDQVENLKNNLTKFFGQLRERNNPNDIVLLYVAGHGTIQGRQLYFMGQGDNEYNIPPGNPVNMVIDPLSAFSRLKRENKIVFLDFCKSGFLQLYNNDYVLVVPSCSGNDDAIEKTNVGKQNGVFTRAVLDGLAGEADKKNIPELVRYGNDFGNGDGRVDLVELFNYVRKRVRQLTNETQVPPAPSVKDNYPIVKY